MSSSTSVSVPVPGMPVLRQTTSSTSTATLASPRSSTSSDPSSMPPLTPQFDLSQAAGELHLGEPGVGGKVVPKSPSVSSSLVVEESDTEHDRSVAIPIPTKASSLFSDFSFPPAAVRTSANAVKGEEGPKEGFTFGTCPADSVSFLGTPTAEKGAFEYPAHPDAPSSPPSRRGSELDRRGSISIAAGLGERRGSIIPGLSRNVSIDRRPSHAQAYDYPSPPQTRRSSTCSTITTLPIAGRRPSILHAATIPTTTGLPLAPLASDSNTIPEASPAGATAFGGLAGPSRRTSILFPTKLHDTPIPPSLLARRGSLPAHQLNLEAIQRGYTTTTAMLYRRRESLLSESGTADSSGSTSTIAAGGNDGSSTRRASSHLPAMPAFPRRGSQRGGSLSVDTEGAMGRRQSLPFFSPTSPPGASPFPPGTTGAAGGSRIPGGLSPSGSMRRTSGTNAASPHGASSHPQGIASPLSARYRPRQQSAQSQQSGYSSHSSRSSRSSLSLGLSHPSSARSASMSHTSSLSSSEEEELVSGSEPGSASSETSHISLGTGGSSGPSSGGNGIIGGVDMSSSGGKVVLGTRGGGGFVGFTDSWAAAQRRPILESIPSDETERP